MDCFRFWRENWLDFNVTECFKLMRTRELMPLKKAYALKFLPLATGLVGTAVKGGSFRTSF